jgi:hypothetical protein
LFLLLFLIQFVMMWLCGAFFLLAAFAASGIPTANLGHNLSCFLVRAGTSFARG